MGMRIEVRIVSGREAGRAGFLCPCVTTGGFQCRATTRYALDLYPGSGCDGLLVLTVLGGLRVKVNWKEGGREDEVIEVYKDP